MSFVSAALREMMRRRDWEPADLLMAPQEGLDLMLMLMRRKPLYLVRGFNPPGWVDVLEMLAAHNPNLIVQRGPMWTASNPPNPLPDVAATVLGADVGPQGEAVYLTRLPEVAAEVQAINEAGGRPTMEQEARLLGYPECCVRAHYDRDRRYTMTLVNAFLRGAGNDPIRARQMFAENAPVSLTEEEKAMLHDDVPDMVAAYTSIIMCPSCVGDPHSPARRLAHEQALIARSNDPVLAMMIDDAHATLVA